MNLQFQAFSAAETAGRPEWNQLATNASPMMEWEYFYCLEQSESVKPSRGYRPRHLAAYLGGDLVALAPMYQRDRAWVEFGDGGLIELLTEITGMPFNQGLMAGIPLTPVPGYGFLAHPELESGDVYTELLNYIDFMCAKGGLGTSRVYFLDRNANGLRDALERCGYVGLKAHYLLWFNQGYTSYDHYLSTFKSSRRRKIKRELRDIRDSGVEIRVFPASGAADAHFDRMYELYRRTWYKYMSESVRPFLNLDFFRIMGRDFRHRIVFSEATRNGETLALAIFYRKDGMLYGRYWGCYEEVPFLHFATCYYYPIQYAIEQGIACMDPGFGGMHKIYRGFELTPVHHYLKFHGERLRKAAHSVLRQLRISEDDSPVF